MWQNPCVSKDNETHFKKPFNVISKTKHINFIEYDIQSCISRLDINETTNSRS